MAELIIVNNLNDEPGKFRDLRWKSSPWEKIILRALKSNEREICGRKDLCGTHGQRDKQEPIDVTAPEGGGPNGLRKSLGAPGPHSCCGGADDL